MSGPKNKGKKRQVVGNTIPKDSRKKLWFWRSKNLKNSIERGDATKHVTGAIP